MSTLEIKVEPLDGVEKGVVVRVGGALDQPTRDEFLDTMRTVLAEGRIRCVLDMEHITYANSTAFGDLVIELDQFREKGGELVLLNLQNKVYSMIEILGVNSVLPIVKTMDEARALLKAAATAPPAPQPQPVAPPGPAAGAAPAPGQPPPRVFPARAECAGCAVMLEFAQPGRFKCPHCGALYTVPPSGQAAATKGRTAHPIELTVPCQPRALKALAQLVAALPGWGGYTDLERARLEKAIVEICDVIHQRAYDGNNECTFQVLVLSRDEELAIRFADHGKPLSASAFPAASQYMTEFEHKPRTPKGNVLRMAKRVARG